MELQALWDVTQQFNNKNGTILTSGKIYIYFQNRTALATTYNDEAGNVVNSNPVLLDNNGRATVFADPVYSYTIVVCDYYGKELFSQDIILHNAIATVENVLITGSDGSVTIDTTELSNGVKYDLSVNTDIIATKQSVDEVKDDLEDLTLVVNNNTIDIDNIQDELTTKKDKQTSLTFNGSATKTVKKITQNSNGEMNVEFEDIDLPPEVPNVEITSPNGTIDVQSSTDVQTNTKTFTIDVARDNLQHFIGSYGKSRYEDRQPGPASGFWLHVDDWSEYTYDGDFIINNWQAKNNPWFYVKPGLYLVHAVINYDMNADSANQTDTLNKDTYMRIYTGLRNGLEDGTRYKDWTHEYQLEENSIEVNFIRKVTGNSDNAIEICPEFPYGVSWACLQELQIVKLDSIVGNPDGGGGSTYTAGDCIDITNSAISVKYGKGLTVNAANELEVKAGNGLTFDEDTLEIEINNEVTDVVAAVEKLQRDLDTQITPNFNMPNISKAYDFADPTVSTLANGACMLCQLFTIPINHEIRTITDDANKPTLFGIYAQQNFGHKIMLALYEYTYAKEGQEQGSTTYVGDTGPVTVVGGVNEFPLKNRNPSITELRCDKVYYATLYLPNAARVNGLFLAGCPNYGTQSIPAEPRLTCAVENITWNGQEIDMNDPTATLNHYQEVIIPDEPVYYQYHIGPWQSGYNERWSAPRFYMQIRNGEYNVPVIIDEPFVDLDDALPTGTADMPSFTPSQANSTFRDVTPAMNVTITAFEWIDCMQTAAQWATGQWATGHCVYDSGFANNLSGQSNTVTELGQVGEDGYAHRITFTTPITLTGGTTYRFLCGCSDGTQQFKVWLDPTNIIHASNNGWYLDNYNTIRIEHKMGMYNKLYNSNNSWVI